jgi:hypothetical protein
VPAICFTGLVKQRWKCFRKGFFFGHRKILDSVLNIVGLAGKYIVYQKNLGTLIDSFLVLCDLCAEYSINA